MREVLHPVQADGKQSAQKWSRGKDLGDGLGGRAGGRELWDSVQDSVFIHIYLSLLPFIVSVLQKVSIYVE